MGGKGGKGWGPNALTNGSEVCMKITVKSSAESKTKYLSNIICCRGLSVLFLVWHECTECVADKHVNFYVRILHF